MGEIHKYSTDYDNARTRYLNELGLTVLRYTNDQVLHCIEKVRADLLTYLSPRIIPLPSFRKEGQLTFQRSGYQNSFFPKKDKDD